MDLSIIIVNYNTIKLTSDCIDSIFAHTKGVSFEVIVVDNNSTDGSKEHLANDKRILFVESGDNIGFGRANNLGFKHSSGRYILMLNSDTVLENDILSRMVERLNGFPEKVACLGALLIDGYRQPSCSYGYFINWYDEFRTVFKKENNVTHITGLEQDVDFVSGADLLVRRSVAEKSGLFDPDFFMYYEDMELGFRYKKKGYISKIINEHGIVHLEGASLNNSSRKVRIITKSYFTYLRKTLGPFEFYCAKILIITRRLFTVWHYRWSIKDTVYYLQTLIKA